MISPSGKSAISCTVTYREHTYISYDAESYIPIRIGILMALTIIYGSSYFPIFNPTFFPDLEIGIRLSRS